MFLDYDGVQTPQQICQSFWEDTDMREKVLIAREGEKAISNNKDIGISIDKKFHDHTCLCL